MGSLPKVLTLTLIFTSQSSGLFAQEALEILPPQQVIIGGVDQNTADWPATYVFRRPDGNGVCTATIIGPYALLTAAHCLPDGDMDGRITLRNGDIHTVSCTPHPAYVAGNTTADWALCYAETDVGFRVGLFESVRASESYRADVQTSLVGKSVTLLGFGCNSVGGLDQNFGVLHGGQSTIRSLWSGANHFIKTEGGSALCFGDSGGAAFYVDSAQNRRTIIGVNSRGDIATRSWMSNTWDVTFEKFATDWAFAQTALRGKDVKICGIHSGVDTAAGSCRPQPDRN